jgi:hypothetical protein
MTITVTGSHPDPEQEQTIPEDSTIARLLEAAAAFVRQGIALGHPAPQCVTVTAGGITAQLADTAALLIWSQEFEHRPRVTTYPGSPYIQFAGQSRSNGVQVRLHNGFRPPEPARPGAEAPPVVADRAGAGQ